MNKTKNYNINLNLQTLGINVLKYNQTFLHNSIQKRISETNCKNDEEYFDYIEQNSDEPLILIHSLQNTYSEFFRNSLTFSVLEQIVLPGLIQNKKNSKSKEIRIWSAACASGQESYSIAMLMEEMKSNYGEHLKYRIFATDQSESQIIEAGKGKYATHLLNNLNLKRLNLWFDKKGDIYSVKDKLKINIDFSVFNLFEEHLSSPPASIFGEFDLIMCANLLFYYKEEYQNKILKKVSASLVKGGYLLTGETERDILTKNNYIEIFPQSAIFQKKL